MYIAIHQNISVVNTHRKTGADRQTDRQTDRIQKTQGRQKTLSESNVLSNIFQLTTSQYCYWQSDICVRMFSSFWTH